MATTPTIADDQQQEPQFAPGTVAPAEGTPQKTPTAEQLGPNYEQLEKFYPKAVSALRDLILSYRLEGMVARRDELRRTKQARLFFRGLQYGYYDSQDLQIHLPFGTTDGLGLGVTDDDDGDSPRFNYCTNIYQAFGLAFIAVMSAAIPTPKFYPQSAQSEQDVTTAKACDDVRKVIEKNNSIQKLLQTMAFRMWTDAKVCAYTRYVTDGQSFGFEELPQLEEQPQSLGENSYKCQECGAETPASSNSDQFGLGSTFCQQCQAPLSDDDLQTADSVDVPIQTGTNRVPRGQEMISIFGGLEVHGPPWADELPEWPYLQLSLETHIAKLKASYQHAADKIIASGPLNADDVYARYARQAVKQGLPAITPGDALANLVTFSRTWVQPWSFWQIEEEETRNLLLKLFPDGAYVAFAGEAYCESRNEQMAKCWNVMYGMPGDGQNRPGVGDSMVEVQMQFNDLSNIEQETAEFGIPPILHDSETLDTDAIGNTVAEPATWYPVKIRPNDDIRKKVMQLQPSTVPDQFIKRRQELYGPIGQFLTGLLPSIWGGQLEGNDTASGYAMAREQALGRIGIFWTSMKIFYAAAMRQAIECFRENRTDDVEQVISSEGGDFESKWIRMADLEGHIQVYDDPDEKFPELPGQVRAMLQQIMNDPAIGPMLMQDPGNVGTAKNIMGLRDFTIPNEDSRIKQLREITELLKTGPVSEGGQPDPMTGQPTPPQSTVPIDMLFDNHAIEATEMKRWANSDAGQTAARENPAGFANVQAHYQEHMAAAQQQSAGQSQGKPPTATINFKDLPPDGKAQLAAQDGIHLDPQQLMAQQLQDAANERTKAENVGQQGPPTE